MLSKRFSMAAENSKRNPETHKAIVLSMKNHLTLTFFVLLVAYVKSVVPEMTDSKYKHNLRHIKETAEKPASERLMGIFRQPRVCA